ncbi:MAG TPA: antibiotic biosynthesis monooxygenase family protein [Solirubrobacteraceae bacterium]|nr:antibiotic biosynthesis monooxygenase family protein [Solirubrobacteraceae bacterium]
MSEIYTTGTWTPYPGKEDDFVREWAQFASWASSMPGAGRLSLARDARETERFISFGGWDSLEQVHGWKGSPEFRERMAHVLQHVAEFQPSELKLVASADSGAARIERSDVVVKAHGSAT